MWKDLAALLQVLHEQPETVLSELSKKALERCVETGTCNQPSLAKVCSSMRCSFCDEVIDGKLFTISVAIWRNQYIECEECMVEHSGWRQELYDALPEEDKVFLESIKGIIACELSDEENERIDDLIERCHDWSLPDGWEEENKRDEENMAEDEKVVYPNGRYGKAHWERLLEKRGVPLVPIQLKT